MEPGLNKEHLSPQPEICGALWAGVGFRPQEGRAHSLSTSHPARREAMAFPKPGGANTVILVWKFN